MFVEYLWFVCCVLFLVFCDESFVVFGLSLIEWMVVCFDVGDMFDFDFVVYVKILLWFIIMVLLLIFVDVSVLFLIIICR